MAWFRYILCPSFLIKPFAHHYNTLFSHAECASHMCNKIINKTGSYSLLHSFIKVLYDANANIHINPQNHFYIPPKLHLKYCTGSLLPTWNTQYLSIMKHDINTYYNSPLGGFRDEESFNTLRFINHRCQLYTGSCHYNIYTCDVLFTHKRDFLWKVYVNMKANFMHW